MAERTGLEGRLIAFEGIDGAGKTTQARLLLEALTGIGLSALLTKEPTDGPHGQRLRESARSGRLSVDEELALFIADRRDHIEQQLRPRMEAGDVVLVDRYYYSTAAYQGARGLDWREIIRTNEEFAPRPDLVLILDCSPESGRRRIARRGDTANDFEDLANLAAVRTIFLQMSSAVPETPTVMIVNSEPPFEKVHQQVLRLVENLAPRQVFRDIIEPWPDPDEHPFLASTLK
ncbi:MAG: thymidylate kinase [Phycisphaerales bacterium]